MAARFHEDTPGRARRRQPGLINVFGRAPAQLEEGESQAARDGHGKHANDQAIEPFAPCLDGRGGAVDLAVSLIESHQRGEVSLAPVNEEALILPEPLPQVNIGHRSLVIDDLLRRAFIEGLALPLEQGLALEAKLVGEAVETVDCDIGMKNFMQNGPRTPALFMHE